MTIQARNLGQATTKLVETGIGVIKDIRQEIPEETRRRAFALTGLDVATCKTIETRILANLDRVRYLLTDPEVQPQEIIRTIHSAIADLPSFTPRYDFVGDIDELIQDWLAQKSMQDITSQHLPAANSDLNRFQRDLIGDYFGYKLPWAIASYIGIANNAMGLDGNVSKDVQWLAPMLRYGVATKEAAWAMTVGCPTRDLSTRIADAFVTYDPDGTYRDFVRWFSGLTSEDFMLQIDASADEARLLVPRAAAPCIGCRSNLLHVSGIKYQSTRPMLSDYSTIARSSRVPAVSVGNAITLTRDYGNPYDVNAITVVHALGELGYMPRHVGSSYRASNGRRLQLQRYRHCS